MKKPGRKLKKTNSEVMKKPGMETKPVMKKPSMNNIKNARLHDMPRCSWWLLEMQESRVWWEAHHTQ